MTEVTLPKSRRTILSNLVLGPVAVIFLSSNVVNAGNLAFNVLFSRWMGPEMFGQLATLLTIKLALLGVLGALQFSASQHIAAARGADAAALDAALSRMARLAFVAMWMILPVVLTVLWWSEIHSLLNLNSVMLLVILGLSLPFAVPLSFLRGVAIGRLDSRAVVTSANVEMAIRLLGGIVAWQAGLGLPGVVAAIAASIVAGWLPLVRLLPARNDAQDDVWKGIGKSVCLAAIPFGALQIAQVALLDADVVVATTVLGETEAGYVAALSLFQRIQFFACFGLATVLLPSVTNALVEGRSAVRPAMSVLGLFAFVSATVLSGAALFPEWLIGMMVGTEFLPAAPVLLTAAAASVAFTLSYLSATLQAAAGDRTGIWVIVLVCPAQIIAMALFSESLPQMLNVKLVFQCGLALVMVALCFRRCGGVQKVAADAKTGSPLMSASNPKE